jgi:hypothetical protein
MVRPVKRLPITSLIGRVVGSQVRLANGDHVWALIGNVDVGNSRLTQHFLSMSVFREGRSCPLARYFDPDYERHGPVALAEFLQLPVDDVFPISYDIRASAIGDPAALAGSIEKEPRERLTRAQVIALAVPAFRPERG